eukprot:6182655-Pleurochrysis_carterae.AAC.1
MGMGLGGEHTRGHRRGHPRRSFGLSRLYGERLELLLLVGVEPAARGREGLKPVEEAQEALRIDHLRRAVRRRVANPVRARGRRRVGVDEGAERVGRSRRGVAEHALRRDGRAQSQVMIRKQARALRRSAGQTRRAGE